VGKLLSYSCRSAKAGAIVSPDVAWADGSFARLRNALTSGKRAIFMTYPRVVSGVPGDGMSPAQARIVIEAPVAILPDSGLRAWRQYHDTRWPASAHRQRGYDCNVWGSCRIAFSKTDPFGRNPVRVEAPANRGWQGSECVTGSVGVR
jgi:hypothetical protein